MRISPAAFVIAIFFATGCGARSAPQPTFKTPGMPYVSWIIMRGDRDNPDEAFVCQSDPRNDCVVPVSRPAAQVFSNVYVYYHGAGADTKYTGSIDVGFFQGAAAAHTLQTDLTLLKSESVRNQSVSGIVSSVPGTHSIDFNITATAIGAGTAQPIQMRIPVVLK